VDGGTVDIANVRVPLFLSCFKEDVRGCRKAMGFLFKAKTNEGYIMKILVELLHQVIITACFTLAPDGIFLRMMDSQRKILVNLEMHADQFIFYELEAPMQIGITLSQFYKMLRSIKKKDSLHLFIEADKPSSLQFYVQPQDNNRQAHSSIQIQNVQNVSMDLPTGYPHPVIISSSEYQCTLKDMNNISSTLRVELQARSFHISAFSENVVSRTVAFGELDDSTERVYDEQFEMEHFNRILKIAGLGKTLHIYGTETLPLQIKSTVGQLGFISIYMKSTREQQVGMHSPS
jgi:proliferating cell nuclear antigen PCNA